jgi:hypothetical protein
MMPEDKIEAVKQYLQEEFPGRKVYDKFDMDHMSQKFWVVGRAQYVRVERLFFNNDDIKASLAGIGLSKVMKDYEDKNIIVGEDRLAFE